MSVNIGTVETWDTGCTVQEQGLRVLEEAGEVFAETRIVCNASDICAECDMFAECEMVEITMDECADVIAAACNLLRMIGVEDATEIMAECARRQRERGRL